MSDTETTAPRPTVEIDGRTFLYFKVHGWRLRMLTGQGVQWIDMGTHTQADLELAMQSPAIRERIIEVMSDNITRSGIEKSVGRTINWGAALDEWKLHLERRESLAPGSVSTYLCQCRRFAKYFGLLGRPVNAVTDEQVNEWVNGNPKPAATGRKTGPHGLRWASRTIRHVSLRRFLEWAANMGYAIGNAARAVRKINTRILPLASKEAIYKKPWKPEDIQLMLDFLAKKMAKVQAKIDLAEVGADGVAGIVARSEVEALRDQWRWLFGWRCAVIISRYTGLRLSDCACLEWDSILPSEFTNNGANMLVYTQKRDRRLSIPMPPQVRELIPAMLEQKNDSRYVFRLMAQRSQDYGIASKFSEWARQAGLAEGLVFHGLRVTYAYACRDAGYSDEAIQSLLTHLDAETTARYLGGKLNHPPLPVSALASREAALAKQNALPNEQE